MGLDRSACAESWSTRCVTCWSVGCCAPATTAAAAIATQSATTKRAALTKLGQLFEDGFFVRLLADLVHVDISNDALFVDEEYRAFGESTVTQYAVFLRGFTMWPEIGE